MEYSAWDVTIWSSKVMVVMMLPALTLTSPPLQASVTLHQQGSVTGAALVCMQPHGPEGVEGVGGRHGRGIRATWVVTWGLQPHRHIVELLMPVWVVFEALCSVVFAVCTRMKETLYLVSFWHVVGFEVKCPTVNLEDIRIVGSLPELGSWQSPQGCNSLI